MKTRAILTLAAVLGVLTVAVRAEEKHSHKAPEKHPGLEQFKQLAGEWTGTMTAGKEEYPVTAQYKVTSAGSAVVETMGAGTPHEMVTVIHADNKDLVLTHYCAAGNQPRMRVHGGGDGGKFDFQFDSATNLKSDKDMHMHSVVYTIVDKDTLKADWTNYVNGKKGGTANFVFKRKK
jgi:hypothetical protein